MIRRRRCSKPLPTGTKSYDERTVDHRNEGLSFDSERNLNTATPVFEREASAPAPARDRLVGGRDAMIGT